MAPRALLLHTATDLVARAPLASSPPRGSLAPRVVWVRVVCQIGLHRLRQVRREKHGSPPSLPPLVHPPIRPSLAVAQLLVDCIALDPGDHASFRQLVRVERP